MNRNQKLSDLNKMTPYYAAKKALREQILSGQFGNGGKFTPELDICRQFNISRTTVRHAISELVEEGLLVRYQGRGTFVRYKRSSAQKRLLSVILCQHTRVPGAYDLFIQGAIRGAAELKYELMVSYSDNNSLAIMEQVMRLNDLRTAGTIIMPIQSGESDELILDRVTLALKGADQKIVLADTYEPQSEFPTISSDNHKAMYDLTNYLIEHGYRKIAFLTNRRIETVAEREQGFMKAMSDHGLEVPPHFMLETVSYDSTRQGNQEVDVFLAMREPPEAIVCLHDVMAINVLNACAKRGWRVPHQVAVVGFDGLPQGANTKPALTTMSQPLYDMGVKAVKLLIDQLEGRKIDDLHPRLPCTLVVRESCSSINSPKLPCAPAGTVA